MSYYSTDNARRSLLHTATFRIASQAATLASYVVLVRAMSEHDFGVFNLLYAIIPVVSTIASLGVEQVLRRFEPMYLQERRFQLAAWLVRTAAWLRASSNLVILALILLLWQWLAPVFRIGPYRAEFLVFSIVLLMHFQAGILHLSLCSHMLHRYSSGMITVLAVAKLLIYSVLSLRGELALMSAIVADCVAYGAMYAGLWYWHRRHCRHPQASAESGVAVPSEEKRRLIRYGAYNNFNEAGSLLLTSHSDNFFVAAMMSPVAVGTYAFYSRLNEMSEQLLPTRQFSTVMLPMLFAVPGTEAAERLPRYLTLLIDVTLCFHLPILGFFLVYHRELVDFVFAGRFAEASWLLPLISLFAVGGSVSELASYVAQYHERAGTILLSKAFAFANIFGLLLLVPVWGIYGAALSTGLSVVLKNGFIWWRVRGHARWRNALPALGSSLLVWGAFVTGGWLLKGALPAVPLVQLAAGVLLCAVFAVLNLRSPVLSTEDRELIERLAGESMSKYARRLGLLPQRTVA